MGTQSVNCQRKSVSALIGSSLRLRAGDAADEAADDPLGEFSARHRLTKRSARRCHSFRGASHCAFAFVVLRSRAAGHPEAGGVAGAGGAESGAALRR